MRGRVHRREFKLEVCPEIAGSEKFFNCRPRDFRPLVARKCYIPNVPTPQLVKPD